MLLHFNIFPALLLTFTIGLVTLLMLQKVSAEICQELSYHPKGWLFICRVPSHFIGILGLRSIRIIADVFENQPKQGIRIHPNSSHPFAIRRN